MTTFTVDWIPALFDAAKSANIIGHPNALSIVRNGGKWYVVIAQDGGDSPSGCSPLGTGNTATEAVRSAIEKVQETLANRASAAARDANASTMAAEHLAKTVQQ